MKTKIIPYNPILKELARKLRNNLTYGEALLWKYLKGKQMRGYDFHRQKPINEFIVDFYCPRLSLVIEIDGASHVASRVNADLKRQQVLESLGLKVIRFTEKEVLQNIEGVLNSIKECITHP